MWAWTIHSVSAHDLAAIVGKLIDSCPQRSERRQLIRRISLYPSKCIDVPGFESLILQRLLVEVEILIEGFELDLCPDAAEANERTGKAEIDLMAFTIKLRDLIAFLTEHGWEYKNTEGDHHHYIHPTKTGKVTVVGERGTYVGAGLVNSILRQAGLTRKELLAWLNR